MEEQELSSVFTALRQAREQQNISLQDAAQVVNIPLHYLQTLETGEDSRVLADPMYLIPFLRRYAAFLDLDPDEAVRQFLAERRKSNRVRIEKQPANPFRPARFSAWLVPLVVLVGGLVGLAFFVQAVDLRSWWMGSTEPPVEADSEAAGPSSDEDSDETLDDLIARLAGPSPEEEPPAAALPLAEEDPEAVQRPQAPSEFHQLHIRAVERTWVRVVVDENFTQELMLQPNEQGQWQARDHFTLTVGNAGGIVVTLDGNRLPPLGRSGEVVRQLRFPTVEEEQVEASSPPPESALPSALPALTPSAPNPEANPRP